MSAPPTARLRSALATLGFFLVVASHVGAQCAMCKEAVDGDKAAGGGVADGIALSILFMLALPVSILGGFSFAIWRSYKKAEAVGRNQD